MIYFVVHARQEAPYYLAGKLRLVRREIGRREQKCALHKPEWIVRHEGLEVGDQRGDVSCFKLRAQPREVAQQSP